MEYKLIHANLSLAKYSHNHELMNTFWSREESIYDQAKTFDGFVRDIDFPDRFSEIPEPYIVNATAWNDFDDLKNFVYASLRGSVEEDTKMTSLTSNSSTNSVYSMD